MSLADILRKHLYFDPVETLTESQFDLVKYLEGLSEKEIIPAPTPDQTYRVSHVIKLCPREEVLRFQHGVAKTKKISAKLKRTFQFGENFHTMMQNKVLGPSGYLVGDWKCMDCKSMHCKDQVHPKICPACGGEEFEYQELTPSNKEHGISAHVDGILLVGGVKTVLELKTTNAISYRLVTELEKKPMDSHVDQISMYMWLMDIPRGIILYYDKNESGLAAWKVTLNMSYVNTVLNNLRAAREGMRTGTLPIREACDSITCTRARACPVSKLCFQE